MKLNKLLTLLLIFLSTILFPQEPILYEKVIRTDSIGKDLLFATINDWFASNYNSANDVIQMIDKDAGILIGKGSMRYDYGWNSSCNGNVSYTIKIYVKENRFKVILRDFNHLGDNYSKSVNFGLITNSELYTTSGMFKGYYNNSWKDLKIKMKKYSSVIFESLENKTKNYKQELIEDDW